LIDVGKVSLKEYVFVNSALKLQCHIVKDTLYNQFMAKTNKEKEEKLTGI